MMQQWADYLDLLKRGNAAGVDERASQSQVATLD